jgi:DNA-binding Xre family transcriptional regulator
MVPEILYLVGRNRIIVLRIKAAAEGQGKTIIGLMEETSLAYNTVLQIFRGSVSRVDLKTLDASGLALHAQPGDLMSWAPDPDLAGTAEQNASTRAPT